MKYTKQIRVLLGVILAIGVTGSAHASCGEASCVAVQGTYISHFTGAGCTGTESYYLPYNSYGYDCRTWDGDGQCGTIERTVTNRSYRYNGTCYDQWPSGNTLSEFVTVYRPYCGEASCVPAQGAYISHFTGTGCTGTESYYLPYNSYGYDCRTWDGDGQCGTVEHTVTNRSYRYNGTCYDQWPSGNTLSEFVTIYRSAPPPPPTYPPVACGYASTYYGTAPLGVWFYGSCSYDPDGGYIATYQWDLWETTSWGSATYHTFYYPGTYPIWLDVWDDEGQWDSYYLGTIWVD